MKKHAWMLLLVLAWMLPAACIPRTPEAAVPGVASSTPRPADAPRPTGAAPQPSVVTPTSSVPQLGEMRVSGTDLMEQVYIPAGGFLMGSNDGDAARETTDMHDHSEIPLPTVFLDGFWIDRFEVNNGQYASCVDSGACQPPYASSSDTRPQYYDNPEFADYPVIWVNWYMAQDYCQWADRRLPTEAEWEKAARGTEGYRYPWGNDFLTDPLANDRANWCDVHCPREIASSGWYDGYADTAPVGSYPAGASPYGVMDMAGNVWEWTTTIVSLYPYDPGDGREDLAVEADRIWRSGPWNNGIWYLRTTVRHFSPQWYWFVNLGFRCASTK
ncbi:MAG: hypothetical protein FJZ96_15600 [Chloroflexi bacterium]|nr:hypothetical protein [Chloroflexota bacterium]